MMSEIVWKEIPGYEGLYEVSNTGFVRRADTKRMMSRWTCTTRGYWKTRLSNNGTAKGWDIHTLVLLAFVGPRPEGHECRHLDGDRTNANLNNLQWGTAKENQNDRHRHGTHNLGENSARVKYTEERIRSAIEYYNTGVSALAVDRKFNFPKCFFSAVVTGSRWPHLQQLIVKRNFKQEKAERNKAAREMYLTGQYTVKQVADKFGMSHGGMEKIVGGLKRGRKAKANIQNLESKAPKQAE
jgi:hypothetical protein